MVSRSPTPTIAALPNSTCPLNDADLFAGGPPCLNSNVGRVSPRGRGPRVSPTSSRAPAPSVKRDPLRCGVRAKMSIVKQRRDNSGRAGRSGNTHRSSALAGASHLHGHSPSGGTLDKTEAGDLVSMLSRRSQPHPLRSAQPACGRRSDGDVTMPVPLVEPPCTIE